MNEEITFAYLKPFADKHGISVEELAKRCVEAINQLEVEVIQCDADD